MSGGRSAPVQASCVAIDGQGVLIRGQSGSGKSGLALQLLALGAGLVGDDGVRLRLVADRVLACPPPAIAGLIEARGIGILQSAAGTEVPLALVVDMDRASAGRMPEAQVEIVLGVELELISGKDVANLAAAIMVKLRNSGRK